uniref:Uncharacterized protein n=1 Tax=Caulobacter phage BL57 TaxID=3348355 RepID=A0AB74UMB8_9VIRU
MSDDFDKRFDERKAAIEAGVIGDDVQSQLRLPFPNSAEDLIKRFSSAEPVKFVIGAAVPLSLDKAIDVVMPEDVMVDLERAGRADHAFIDLPFEETEAGPAIYAREGTEKTLADCKAKFADGQKAFGAGRSRKRRPRSRSRSTSTTVRCASTTSTPRPPPASTPTRSSRPATAPSRRAIPPS